MKYCMCASASFDDAAPEEKQAQGIANQHAYGLIAAVRLTSPKVDLVQLRNPWGKFEWNGDWSDKSEQWKQYPKLKQQLKVVDADDGLFWMSF